MGNKLPDVVVARLREAGVEDLGLRTVRDRRRSARGLSFLEVEERQIGEVRAVAADGDVGHFVGFSTTYDQPYDVYGGPSRGGFSETMVAGSWTRSIDEKVDINLLVNHEGAPYARVGNGTLRLSEPGEGVFNEGDLDLRRTDARDLYYTLERGDFWAMSCAFMVMRDKWSGDFTQRFIYVALGADSSVVTFPANPNTSASVTGGEAAPPPPAGRSLRLARDEWYRLSA